MALDAFVNTSAPAGVASSANVIEYTATIATASSGRLVVLAVATESANANINSATMDGVTMIAGLQAAFSTTNFCRLFYLPSTTGTTAVFRVAVGSAVAASANRVALYTVASNVAGLEAVRYHQGTVNDTDSDPISATAIVVAGGVGICVASLSATAARTWTGFTESLDTNTGQFQFTTGLIATAATSNITISGANLEDGCLAFMTFREFNRRATMVAVLGM